MKTQILSLSILAALLSSCMNQPSAPISYGTSSSSSAGNSSYNSDDIVEQPIIREKTTWGEKTVEETLEPTQNEIDEAPPAPQAPPLRTETISHEVIEGETIDSIAKQYGIERDALIKANKLKAPYRLEELQILKIPPQLSDNDNSLESVSKINETEGSIKNVSKKENVKISQSPIRNSNIEIEKELKKLENNESKRKNFNTKSFKQGIYSII